MIELIEDNVLVRPNPLKTQTEGGIIIPDVSQKRPVQGTVVAVGEGRVTPSGIAPMESKVGDEVIYLTGTGIPLVIDREEFLVLREFYILAKI